MPISTDRIITVIPIQPPINVVRSEPAVGGGGRSQQDITSCGIIPNPLPDEEFEPKQIPEQPAPFSFFRVISMAIFGRRRARKDIWRPPADTDPPESRFETAVSDPDAD